MSQWQAPATPTLVSVLVDNATVRADFLATSNPQILLPPRSVVDIVISGGAGGFRHPIHLHGHDFAVLSERRNEQQVPCMVRREMRHSALRVRQVAAPPASELCAQSQHCLTCAAHATVVRYTIVFFALFPTARHHPSGRESRRDAVHHRQPGVRRQCGRGQMSCSTQGALPLLPIQITITMAHWRP